LTDERIKELKGIVEANTGFQAGMAYEEALVGEALTSPDALEGMCGLYVPRIYNYVLRRVGRVEDAEDITSIVFEKVLLNLKTYDSDRASFSTWIFRIAINSINDFYRSARRKKETTLEEAALIDRPCTDSELERFDLYLTLTGLMQRLSVKYQEVLTLRYFGDMKVSEMAETLGISETAASKRLVRGLEQLMKLAEDSQLREFL